MNGDYSHCHLSEPAISVSQFTPKPPAVILPSVAPSRFLFRGRVYFLAGGAIIDSFPPIKVVEHDPVVVIELLCEQLLDGALLDRIERDILEAIKEKKPPLLVICFSQVRHLSSMALRTLLNLRQEIIARQGQIRLAAIRTEIREVFSTTRLDTLFQIHSDTQEALNKIQNWLRLVKPSVKS